VFKVQLYEIIKAYKPKCETLHADDHAVLRLLHTINADELRQCVGAYNSRHVALNVSVSRDSKKPGEDKWIAVCERVYKVVKQYCKPEGK
jgi:hypothetical protein